MPMLRPQKEKKPPQPGKLKMFGHIGHLGHLTPKPQQNRPFFNLSKTANPQNLGHLARPRPPVEAWMPKSRWGRSQASGRHGCRNPDVTGVANRDLPAPNSQLLTPYQKKLVDLVDLENLAPQKKLQRQPAAPRPSAGPARCLERRCFTL